MSTDLNPHRSIKVTADDDVPAEVRRAVVSRVESLIRGAAADDFIQVTIARRKNPNEIYDVRVGRHGREYQHDFERGDLESERFDIWLREKGEHLSETCWCGHPAEDHSIPQCASCEV